MSARATAAIIFGLGFAVSLAGDACHVASGTTQYEWDDVPTLWKSAVWFPFLVAGSILAGAWLVERQRLPAVRRRGRADAVTGAAAVLALYAVTALVRGEPTTVSVVLTAALALAIWSWWDPSLGTFVVALGAAIAGPLVEIGITELGAASYAADSDGLGGVAPWLPCLYFGAGAVASTLWAAIARDGRAS